MNRSDRLIKTVCCLLVFAFSLTAWQPLSAKGAGAVINAKSGMAAQPPRIVETLYPTDDIVIADIVATEAPYYADATGAADCTQAIQRAIDDCYAAGGGTVFLPAGTYRVTGSLHIKSFVTLRGDWQDPDKGNAYGTVISAEVPSIYNNLPALINIGGSAGAMGLTVYYPEQDIDHVKPYPYTFYVPGSGAGFMLQSIVNCTVINGYKGLAACLDNSGHEMMTVENFKGTFLCRAATAYNQSDVGTWKNVSISPKYWANAGRRSAPLEKIQAYTRANAIGLTLGDLEWTQFANLKIDACKWGLHLVKGKRIEFAGALYNAVITNCNIGILADAIDERWGMVLANSRVCGSENAIVNNTLGVIKMAGVQLEGGPLAGKVQISSFSRLKQVFKVVFGKPRQTARYMNDCTDLSAFTADYAAAPHKPTAELFVLNADKTGAQDVSAKLQALLNAAAGTGGVVYLPAGRYKLEQSIEVPAGVELRGSSSVATRDQGGLSLGTVIYACFGLNAASPDSDTAQITLRKNAGVRGIRFVYPGNSCVKPGALGQVLPCSYLIRGAGSGVYAVNTAIAAAYNGIDFRGCDNHFIAKLVSCCYNNAVIAGNCEGGIIQGCLQNGTVMSRNGLGLPDWVDEGTQMFPYLFNAVTRVNTEYIKLVNAKDETVFNCFAYGVKTLVILDGSENTLAFNIGADNAGGTMLVAKGGSATVVNMMRWNGASYSNQGTKLAIYNRLTIDDRTEKTVKS